MRWWFPGEEAVEVFAFLDLDDGANRLGEQTGIEGHVPTVIGDLIESTVGRRDWLGLIATSGTGKIEKLS